MLRRLTKGLVQRTYSARPNLRTHQLLTSCARTVAIGGGPAVAAPNLSLVNRSMSSHSFQNRYAENAPDSSVYGAQSFELVDGMLQRDDLVFDMDEYKRRLKGVRAEMAERNVDCLLVTGPENITYLTGYQTTGYYYFQCVVIPMEDEPFMVTRLLEHSNVVSRTWVNNNFPYVDTVVPIEKLSEVLRQKGLDTARIGYERNCYFFRAPEQEMLFTLLPLGHFQDCTGTVEKMRVVKSPAELQIMQKAANATEAGMLAGMEAARIGVSEDEIAAEIHSAMFRAGGHYPACSPFVAVGHRCSIGHATWEGNRIQPGDAVFLEIGGCYHRYHAAMMRTMFVGDRPDFVDEAEAVVNGAVGAAMKAMVPGATLSEVDALCVASTSKNSFGAVQSTRSGYSIGIGYAPDWGEGQIMSMQPNDHRPLEENMVFHLIPWIQIPGKAGIGLSETVVVTPEGGKSLFALEREVVCKL